MKWLMYFMIFLTIVMGFKTPGSLAESGKRAVTVRSPELIGGTGWLNTENK